MVFEAEKLWRYMNCGGSGGFVVAETEGAAIQALQDKYGVDEAGAAEIWPWVIDDYYDQGHPNVLDVYSC